jgi:hypothetical protein
VPATCRGRQAAHRARRLGLAQLDIWNDERSQDADDSQHSHDFQQRETGLATTNILILLNCI